jgi:hypothetical protein
MRRELRPVGATMVALAVLVSSQVSCVSPRDVPLPLPVDGPAQRADARPGQAADGPGGTGEDGPGSGGSVDPDPAACAPGEQLCPGVGCVDRTSPEHCGQSCAPCPSITGGMATCDGTRCGISCPAGMQPCLDRCIEQGAACDGACPAMQRACNGACVDVTNLAACGPACMPCPTSPSGKATCNGTSCELACNPGYHLCEDNSCRADKDIRSCGTSCTPCPAPVGGMATCDGTVCGAQCPANTKLCAGECIPTNQPCMGVCPDGRHDCGGNCVPNDVNFCGPTCKQCRPPANADGRCNGTDCEFSCRGGFRECGGQCLANDRPCNGSCPSGSKVCGDRCVPNATCCTDGREGCNDCFSCSAGTCTRQADGTGCGNNLVCRAGGCLSCGGLGQICCAGNRCSGSGLSCQSGTCRGECTPGQRDCMGQTPRVCSAAGQWQNGSACNRQACVGGSCTGNCAPGERGCGGNETPQVCNSNGQMVPMGAACRGVCRGEGMCVGVCRRGQQQCQGQTQVQVCNDSGQFQPPQPCVNQTCLDDRCQGNCAPSQRRCSTDGTAVESCQNGQFRTTQACDGVCRNEMCFGNCRGTGARCADNRRVVCVDNFLETTACPAPEAGVPRCRGNGQCGFDCQASFRTCGSGCCFDLTGSWSDLGFGNTICARHDGGPTVSFDYVAGPNSPMQFVGSFSGPETMQSQFGQGDILSRTVIQWPGGQWMKLSDSCP